MRSFLTGRRFAGMTFALSCLWVLSSAFPAAAQSALRKGFSRPPETAKPMTWWHWMNGNITRAGITADLEAMKRIGLSGAELFNVAQGEPPGPVNILSPEWRELMQFAISEANRLGLRLAVHNCPGWSESGGPWITPEQSMQRVVFTETYLQGGQKVSGQLPQPQTVRGFYKDIAVLAFPTLPGDGPDAAKPLRIPDIAAKSGISPNARLKFPTTSWPEANIIAPNRIVDLSSRLQPDGTLNWDAPAGDWTLVRFGHTSTGQGNGPAPASGSGLECDKMSRTAVKANFAGMMEKVIADAGPLAGQSLQYVLADSWEAGTQNWTPLMREEFKQRMGYDLTPWLPTLTGRVVGSLDRSERFLWDFRRVIADLIAENHYGLMRELCKKHGMLLTAEAPGIGMPTIADELQCKGMTDMPMGEFWIDGHNDSKEAAVSAHIYGKKRASAESFTAVTRDARWMKTPFDHKAIGDLNFCRGINLFVFHRYAMQPWLDRFPGMTMGPWGTNFERTNTWWEQARAWMQYLARCQYLLQAGVFVADACYYYGEGAPNTIVTERSALAPALPATYDYDCCDTTVLLTRMAVKEGRIVLPDGMSYRVLVLPDGYRLTPRVLQKVRELVEAGATVVGPRPELAPTLKDYPQCDATIKSLADALWADCDGKTVLEHTLGKGKIVWGKPMAQVLTELGAPADVEPPADRRMAWIHRRVKDTDLYFISNQEPHETVLTVTLRSGDRRPELWHPDTGRIEPVAQYTVKAGRVTLPLHFDPAGSVFVVFRQPAAGINPIAAATRNGKPLIPDATAAPAGKLTIEKALYGVDPEKGEQVVDVTRQLQSEVLDGRLQSSASNDLAGDPAVNVVKRMRLEYTYNGVHKVLSLEENEEIDLPTFTDQGGKEQAVALPTEVDFSAKGGYRVRSGEAGVYTLTTASGKTLTTEIKNLPAPITVSGPWQVTFPPKWGAPEQVTFDTLFSWTQHPDEGVQHFSGTATYAKEIEIPGAMLGKNRSLWLDLGRVKEVAEVILNGKNLGICWKPPFRLDISRAAKAGKNQLQVRITNLWPNRLIGDAALPPEKRYTYAVFQPFKATDPLLESGLIGPVTIQDSETVTAK